jgi:Skp family chaperone for outer membrane proteins
MAQGPAGVPLGQSLPSASGARIALLDMGKIYKNYTRLNAWTEEFNADYQRFVTQKKGERDAIVRLEERLQEFRRGTPDYKSLEEEIARRKADFTVKGQIQQKEFQQREAKIVYNAYQEVLQVTQNFCRQNRIDIVFQFKSDGIDPEQVDSVGAFISKQVVWSDPGLDITNQILRELNRQR